MACLPTCPLALQRSELLCVSIAPGSSVDAQQSNVHDKDKEQTQKIITGRLQEGGQHGLGPGLRAAS